MSRKKKKREELYRSQKASRSGIRLGFTMVNPKGTPVPAAKPSETIQLSPIVQPIAMAPYSTQQQTLGSDMSDNMDDDF